MSQDHVFVCHLDWTGSSAGPASDYRTYTRDHRIVFEGRPPIEASAAPAFLGDPGRLNPEELLVAAISSCQMLSYLAIMARARLTVTAYRDEATGIMEKHRSGTLWVSRVTLRPHIQVAEGVDLEKAGRFIHTAHEQCFIAASVKTDITIEPTFVTLSGS